MRLSQIEEFDPSNSEKGYEAVDANLTLERMLQILTNRDVLT